MTDPLEHDVAELQTAAQQLAAEAMRAEAAVEAADADVARILARLKAEFDVDSIEAAEALLAQKDAALVAEIASVREALSRARKPVETP